jgi:hypothetical protein
MLRQTQIYLTKEAKPAIVMPMHHNRDGICFEQEQTVIVADWRKPATLAAGLHSAIAQFSFLDFNIRNRKRTEWPAYVASGCRSVREFEDMYFCIRVCAVNEAELGYDAHAQPPFESDITMHVWLNRHGGDEEIGRKLLRLFDICMKWDSYA